MLVFQNGDDANMFDIIYIHWQLSFGIYTVSESVDLIPKLFIHFTEF